MRARLLDLFCGAGGAAMGYHRAGFDVVGVDIKPQPHYPFQFIQGDALVFMERLLMTDTPLGRVHAAGWRLRDFDAIHASPPCQAYSAMSDATGNKDHPRLIQPVRAALALRTAMPWVMENVARSELRATAMLCGTMFGLRVLRHRYFETNISLDLIAPCSHVGTAIGGEYVGHKDGGSTRGRKVPNWTTGEIGAAMGIDWMTRSELRQAIPPAYTEWIGRQLMDATFTPTAETEAKASKTKEERS